MLVMSRQLHERIRIKLPDGRFIWVQVALIDRAKVRLAFDAPRDVQIDREEIAEMKDGTR